MKRPRVTSLAAVAVGLAGWMTVPGMTVDRGPVRTDRAPNAGVASALSPAVPDSALWALAPFRADRRAPQARYGEATGSTRGPGVGEEIAARPGLRLTGIVRGEVQRALVEGLPGYEATTRLVAPGDVFGALTVVSISADTVWVSDGVDRWSYVLEAPWG